MLHEGWRKTEFAADKVPIAQRGLQTALESRCRAVTTIHGEGRPGRTLGHLVAGRLSGRDSAKA